MKGRSTGRYSLKVSAGCKTQKKRLINIIERV